MTARVLQLRGASDLDILSRRLRQEVAHELRACALVSEPQSALPLPCDLSAEEVVLSAVLSDRVKPAELAPLEGCHFYSDFHRELWVAMTELERRVDVDAVVERLAGKGIRGPVMDEVEAIRDLTPFAILATLRAHVAQLLELASRRELIREIQELDVGLRVGANDVAGARARLAAFFRKVSK